MATGPFLTIHPLQVTRQTHFCILDHCIVVRRVQEVSPLIHSLRPGFGDGFPVNVGGPHRHQHAQNFFTGN
jgi:hypothetical protein